MINTFHKDNPDKPTATSFPVNIAPSMAQPTIAQSRRGPTKTAKRKRSQPATTSTRSKKAKT